MDSSHKGQWRGSGVFFDGRAPEQTVERTAEMPVIWDVMALNVTSQ